MILNESYFKNVDRLSKNTFACTEYGGCLYQDNGRCIYNVAPVKDPTSRACNQSEREYECECNNEY
jgi:hypothetical protein